MKMTKLVNNLHRKPVKEATLEMSTNVSDFRELLYVLQKYVGDQKENSCP